MSAGRVLGSWCGALRWLRPPAADLVDALVGEDSGGPRERVGAGAIAPAREVDLHEGLLHRVEGVLVVAEVAEGQAVQSPLVALDEGLEGPRPSMTDSFHEGEVIFLHTPLRV